MRHSARLARLARLEAIMAPKSLPLTSWERLAKLRYLYEYRGYDPEVLRVKARIGELAALCRQRRDHATAS